MKNLLDGNRFPKARCSGRQAITTRYYGPTNFRGARIKASCEAGSVTLSWEHAWNAADNHANACQQLAQKLGWTDTSFIGGSIERGYVFVEVTK